MASLIDPRCDVPLYLMENETIASDCGKLEGYIFAVILTIVVLAISFFIYNKKPKGILPKEEEEKRNNNLYIHIGVTILIIVLVWLIVPFASRWLNVRRWKGYQEQIKSYKGQGFDNEGAIKKIQDMHQTRIQADAIRMGSAQIATALNANRRRINY